MPSIQEVYRFSRSPFSKDVSFKELYRYPQLEQLFDRLRETTSDGAGLLVTGRAGTGKTTAVRGFLDSLGAGHRVIYLGQYQRGNALFARLGLEFGLRSHLIGPKRMVGLVQKVTDESGSGRKLVLVIDEAHLLERPTLEDIRLLTNSDMDRRSPMSLIMLGQRWLRGMLKKEGHEALYQRLRLRYALEGLSEQETREYIQHHLRLAGCNKPLFSNAAVKLIFVASEGILREINNICYESLLVGASRKAASIDQDIVNWVVDQREIS
jgi:type II secretory pathway predicted ATPase ExeA